MLTLLSVDEILGKKEAVKQTKPSSDDDTGVRHGFKDKASLLLNKSTPAVSNQTLLGFCHIVGMSDQDVAFLYNPLLYSQLSEQ